LPHRKVKGKAQRNSMFVKSASTSSGRGEKAVSRRISISEEDDGQSSNVKCFARFRPLNPLEEEFGNVKIRFESDDTVILANGKEEEGFRFAKVFDPDSSQLEVYLGIGQPSVNDVVAGYNATVFAYGQSGSGKTHTMMGNDVFNDELKGVVPRAITDLFQAVMVADQSIEFSFKCSLLEIYKEKLRDLFDSQNSDLRIKESPSRGIFVENLSEFSVACEDEMLELLSIGERMRTVASTNLNAQSSRSHQLFMVEVKQKLPNDTEKRGVLNLVDLAGSEKIGWSGVTGNKLEETKKINLSLSALGNVIHALASHNEHIPYRDSKLTRLLQESLGGNYKTYLVVTCSLSLRNLEETLSTLKFGQRAGIIKNKVSINIKNSPEAYQRIIETLKTQLSNLQNELRAVKGDVPELGVNTSTLSTNLTPTGGPYLKSPRRLFQSTDCSNPTTITEELAAERTPKRTPDSFSSVSINFYPHEACEQALTSERVKANRLKEELDASYKRIKDLEAALTRSNEKHLTAEQRANEYYNNYHKLFRLIDKDSEELRSLRHQNDSLKEQIKFLTKSLNEIDQKFKDSLMRSMSVRGSTVVELEYCEDVFIGEDSVQFHSLESESEELTESPDIRAIPIGSFLLTQPMLNSPIDELEKNTTLSREILVFNLRNQVVHAGLINSNMVRKYHSLDWKYCLIYHKYEEKRIQVESLKQRLKSLEELLDNQHQSYVSIIKLTEKMKFTTSIVEDTSESPIKKMPSITRFVTKRSTAKGNLMRVPSLTPKAVMKSSGSLLNLDSIFSEPQSVRFKTVESNLVIQQSFSHQLRKALDDASSQLNMKDQALQELEQRVYIAHKQETEGWRKFIEDFRVNMETEIQRKYSEVSRLNEVLGDWIHRYMDLQEVTGIPSSRGSNSHRRNLSSVYVSELNELITKTKTSSSPTIESPLKLPKLDTAGLEARSNSTIIQMKRGDMTPPVSDR